MKTSEKLKKNVKPIVIAGAAVACLGIAGVSAYFTDAAKVTNTFTVGKVEITPSEPDWRPPTDIVPNQEFEKNPTVTNSGDNAAFVYVQVKVPKKNVVVADQDGTKHDAAATPLFTYTINAGWAEVPETAENTDEYELRTYVYGTADTPAALEAGDTTSAALFDYIKFANVIEGQEGIEQQDLNVDVTTYAIQTTWLNDETNNGVDGSAATSSKDIWAILKKQAPTVDDVTDEVVVMP